ncbi:hypothetical protein ABZ946_35700 [Streptomyces sp. NPDC046324]|uniref:hypothetical protein n=1 Tax=Streptomyces sp. NPDC046324 TaxID=3154915 RepID=UPI0033E17734
MSTRRSCSNAVDTIEQRPGLPGATVTRAKGGQAGLSGGCGQRTGLGVTPQTEEGGGHGQLDCAGFRAALLFGQTAAQLLGTLGFGESLLVAALTVEAAGQTETQYQGEPVRYAMGGECLAR